MSTQMTFPQVMAVARLALMVTHDDVLELQAFFRRRHSIGCILNPTAYRNEADMAEKAEAVTDAFAAFHAVVGRLQAQELDAMAAGG